MNLIDALTEVANSKHDAWRIKTPELELRCNLTADGPDYEGDIYTTGMGAQTSGEDWRQTPGVTRRLEWAIAWLVQQGKRDALLGDRWEHSGNF